MRTENESGGNGGAEGKEEVDLKEERDKGRWVWDYEQ